MTDELFIDPPGNPQLQALAENFRQFIQMFGWEKLESTLVTELNLTLVREEGRQRFYERDDGLKITITSGEIQLNQTERDAD